MKYLLLFFSAALFACNHGSEKQPATVSDSSIPAPAKSVVNFSKVIGWEEWSFHCFVPFKDGKPSGPAEGFLTGFIANNNEVYGRPVGVAVAPDGSLLVADDASNTIWMVSKE